MLATSAMNGAVMDSTYNVFFKLKFQNLYDQVLATPMRTFDVARGELAWAMLRGGIYAAVFLLVMLVMGLVTSWWALLIVPAALLIGFAFSGVGLALTTWMRSWQHFEFIQLAIMPMFLFSATFFPVQTYPGCVRWVVELTPLYRGVVLVRELSTGLLTWGSLISRRLPCGPRSDRTERRLAPTGPAPAEVTARRPADVSRRTEGPR